MKLLDPALTHASTASQPQANGAAIVVSPEVVLTAEEENAQLRMQLAAVMDKNREQALTILGQEQKIGEQTSALRREAHSRYILERQIQLSELVGAKVEKLIGDLHDIEVTDPVAFFDYLMNQLPEELDCHVRYYVSPSNLKKEVVVRNGKKSDIFVGLLKHSYAEIQNIRSAKGIDPMKDILFHTSPELETLEEQEIFPIVIDSETVGYIEFIREKGARKLLPNIRPQFLRVMRLINSHLDKVRYETAIRENAEIMEENERIMAESARVMAENLSILQNKVDTDTLTGVSSRYGFFTKTERMLTAYPDISAHAIFIDFDFFKSINELYGHSGGDTALREIAQTAKSELIDFMETKQLGHLNLEFANPRDRRSTPPEMYEIGRVGGEEFIIQVHGVSDAEVLQLAEKLRMRVESDFREFRNHSMDMRPTSITISLGVAKFTKRPEGEFLDQWRDRILGQSNMALQLAKHSGRNQVVMYNEMTSGMLAQKKQDTEEKNQSGQTIRHG